MRFDKIGSVASKAFDKMDKATGNDMDLELYSKMNDDVFKALTAEYGEGNVVEYIKAMEYRRLQNAKNPQT